MKRRHLIAPALLTVMLLASTVGATSARQGRAGQADFSGTLTILDWGTLGNPVGKAMIAGYEKLHPGVHIKTVALGSGDPIVFMNAELAGGTAQDIMVLANIQQVWNDVRKGLWLDLTPYAQAPDPYVPGNKRWLDLVDAGTQRLLPFSDGHYYALTTTGFDAGFYYNKAIFAKLGLPVPATWDTLLADLQKLKAANYIPLDYNLGDTTYGDPPPMMPSIMENMVMDASIKKMDTNHDGRIDIHELVQGIKNGQYSAHNADFQETWKLIKALSPYLQLGAGSSSSGTFNLFKTGRVGLYYSGSYDTVNMAKTNLQWGAFKVPQITSASSSFATPGEKGTGSFGACCGYPWGIPATTKKNGHLAMAMDFINYWSIPHNTDLFAASGGVLSVENAAAKPAPALAPFVDSAHHLSRLATAELAMPPAMLTTRQRLLIDYVLGRLTLAQAVDQMQAEINRDVTRAQATYGFK